MYAKETLTARSFDGIIAEKIHLVHSNGEARVEENMWLFSREDDAHRRYSIGFSLDEAGNLRPVQSDAYCFFKTKEHTGLHFFIHAPFLLNDSREHLVAGDKHNRNMVKLLAELAADSLVCLRDIGLEQGHMLIGDSILDIIPISRNDLRDEKDTDEYSFMSIFNASSEDDDVDKLSFLPFYTTIQEKLRAEKLLPTIDGYVSERNAYWAETIDIMKLFSNEQLAALSGNPDACWVFLSISRSNGRYRSYIDEITGRKWYSETAIINGCEKNWMKDAVLSGITGEFVERQPYDWLHRFYKWLSETDSRTQLIRKAPVFLNREGKSTVAFNERNELILFLPSDGIEDMNTIAPELLDNPDTANFLVKKVGIKRPSRKDYIITKILPLYRSGASISSKPHFKLFFDYYVEECPRRETESFLNLIRPYKFLVYYIDKKAYRETADHLYFPEPNLREYFSGKPNTKFIDLEGYLELVGNERKEDLYQFLSALGVHSGVQIIRSTLNESNSSEKKIAQIYGFPFPRSRYWIKWIYPEIDGADGLLSSISIQKDHEKALLLWRELLELIKRSCDWQQSFEKLLTGRCEYFYYQNKQEVFLAPIGKRLREYAWLIDRDGSFVSADRLTVGRLNEAYNISDYAAVELIKFLRIKDDPPIVETDDILTDEQKQDIELGRLARKLGFTPDEARTILEREKKIKATVPDSKPHSEGHAATAPADDNADVDRAFRKTFERQTPAKKSVLRNILQDRPEESEITEDEEETESDEFTAPTIEYQKRIQRAEEKSRREIDRIACEKELSDQLAAAQRYTYAWFRTLMDLEALSRSEDESRSREISISFGQVELDPGTERTLLLKQPNRYIPHWMEELAADIPLTLRVKGRERRLMIEVVSVKGYTLHTRLRNAEEAKDIDLSRASASISVQNPGFLLESLQKGFSELDLSDDYDMKANLSENIKFIFGPPGTGKTTYIAREELIPMMKGSEDRRVLVLAPTNKAADVLVMRIMDLVGRDNSCNDWLVRFGTTYNEVIEQSAIYRDRSFYLPKLRRCVLVTTIARFPYDSIGGKALCEYEWDCVVIDEASMIPIANIVYPLYRCQPRQFIIAGDPFQIQPVARIEQDENIYKMVGLKSFTQPHTEPHDYEVKLLTTQYRSIPSVGEVFSQFAYDGVLKHARAEDSRQRTNIDDILEIAPLNIIKFPVSKYEGIYRAKRLGNTPYQIYSALLVHEFVTFLAGKIGAANPDEMYSVGVISPYRAQADLIARLLTRVELPPNVRVQADTIHGFQGDECNMIIALFNPPPKISSSRDMFLNKLNIINVSISRARDYLFVLMPDGETENIDQLKLINRVERLMKGNNECREYSSDKIEMLLFGKRGFLEENTFSTSHQNVNVYGVPEKRYEIRSEDTAIDVQIHVLSDSNSITM